MFIWVGENSEGGHVVIEEGILGYDHIYHPSYIKIQPPISLWLTHLKWVVWDLFDVFKAIFGVNQDKIETYGLHGIPRVLCWMNVLFSLSLEHKWLDVETKYNPKGKLL